MSRYIDADKVLEKINKICNRCGKMNENNGVMCGACYFDDAKDMIDDFPTAEVIFKKNLKEEFEREIEIANKDIDLMPEQEDYMRGYLGGILCAYRIVFGKNYEESEEEE